MPDIMAFIPARSGSKSVAHKNIKLLKNYPLIAYSIQAARITPGIDRVIVSTDSEEYAESLETMAEENIITYTSITIHAAR